jgi:antitoxin ParD1/3/4
MNGGSAVPTRNVVLTKHQEQLLKALVASGRYQNVSEVLREGLRLVEQREAEDVAKLQALRDAAQAGFAAFERGEFKEFASSADLEAYLDDLGEEVISDASE